MIQCRPKPGLNVFHCSVDYHLATISSLFEYTKHMRLYRGDNPIDAIARHKVSNQKGEGARYGGSLLCFIQWCCVRKAPNLRPPSLSWLSTLPTWDRTRFQQTRGRGASGKRRYDTHILLNQARTISSAGNKMCWMVLTEDVLKEHRMHTNNDSARVSFPEAPTCV